MRNQNRHLIVAILLCFMSGVDTGTHAEAQEVARARLTPEVALARLCISEAGWECFDTGDGIGIHEVILRGASHQSIRYESYARAYAQRLFGARPHDVPRLRWVGQLTSACTAPEAWPTTISHSNRDGTVDVRPHASWSSYRERCLSIFARAREVVAEMTLDDVDEWGVCDTEVHDWGGFLDEARAQRIGLVPVECGVTDGGTRNTFYCRPGMARSNGSECIEVDRD